ncbi:MAG: right-handed parallel beta-helix repeat-containing protein [Verrucomicrobia bacterium]|nr:right-handed parallel beta-helix repeat-containing protein [Verrucomicrobiota bacterium]
MNHHAETPNRCRVGLRGRDSRLCHRALAAMLALGLILLSQSASGQIPPPNGPGEALVFDGVNDQLTASSPNIPVGMSAYTIEAWIKPNTMHVGAITSWGDRTNSRANVFALTPTGLINYWWANDLSATTPNLSGAWHHVAATFDGITRRILLDGVVLASDFPGFHGGTNTAFQIGSAFSGQFFAGQMDELRIWDVGRSAAQIQGAMRRQLLGSENHLMAYYRFDEGTGLVAADTTGNPANAATLVNGPSWTLSSVAPFVPTITTLPAADLIGSTARLIGSALPHLSDGLLFFEWGLGIPYSDATPRVSFSAAGGALPWSATLSNLIPGLTYHYRAVGTNIYGASFGSDHTFRIPATFIVSTVSDGGPGSLRDAVAAARDGDEIHFAVDGTIMLTSGELLIERSIQIVGPGPDRLAISGNHTSRVLNISSGTVAIRGLAIRDGTAPAGPFTQGGGVSNAAELLLSNCIIAGNTALGAPGRTGDSLNANRGYPGRLAMGGGVYNLGKLTLISCLFRSNSVVGGSGGGGAGLVASGGLGGNGAGGALANDGEATLLNCTLTANSTTGGTGGNNLSASPGGGNGGNGLGGGILNRSNCFLINCTLVGNAAIRGSGGRGSSLSDRGSPGSSLGGGFHSSPLAGGVSKFLNTLIGLNELTGSDPGLNGADVLGAVLSSGHNLVTSTNASTGWITSDQLGSVAVPLPPRIGPLSDNDSAIPSHALLQGSPALDAGDDSALGPPYNLTTDQRGFPRHSGTTIDIGSFEAETQIEVVNANDTGDGSLRAAIGRVAAGGVITFSPTLIGERIVLKSGELVIDKDLTIRGFDFSEWSRTVSIRGGGGRVFRIAAGRVRLAGLLIADGRAVGSPGLDSISEADGGAGEPAMGGAILNSGDLVVSNVVFASNSARGGRGGDADAAGVGASRRGGDGADGFGGAICNSNSVALIDCAFWLNDVQGGDGGKGGSRGNAGDPGGNAGSALGGAIYNAGACSMIRTLIFQATAQGGDGGLGGSGPNGTGGGGGGQGGRGGNAGGGGLYSLHELNLINCTFGENRAVGGLGGQGGFGLPQGAGGDGGDAKGAGFRNRSSASLIHCTFTDNRVVSGDRGESVTAPGLAGAELGGGLFTEATPDLTLRNTLISRNRSSSQPQDIAGSVASQGHNFVGIVGASSGWLASDLLGSSATPLTDGIGAFDGTTYPLLEDSPAIDAGDDGVLGPPLIVTTDARGLPRLSGVHVDIGAFELRTSTGTTFTVQNVLDAGPGSLRQALMDANASPGPDTILFKVPGAGPHAIALLSPLPILTEQVTIDGFTQSGSAPAECPTAAVLKIELSGASAGPNAHGLVLVGRRCTVRGLVINRFSGSGIFIAGGRGHVVEGNHIGTDVAGTIAQGNGGGGIIVSNVPGCTLGGATCAGRNLISGNGSHGVLITGSASTDNVLIGNWVGVDATGQAALGNAGDGVALVGASFNKLSGIAAENSIGLLSGNQLNGLRIESGATNVVVNTFMGLNGSYLGVIGNRGDGVLIVNSPGNVMAFIRSSGNALHGVHITGAGSIGNAVQYSELGSSPYRPFGNGVDGVRVEGAPTNTIGPLNSIWSNNASGVVLIGGAGAVIQGAEGSPYRQSILGNVGDGIRVQDSPGVRIDPQNSVSANGGYGVVLTGPATRGCVIQGSIIGVDVDRAGAFGNALGGVAILNAPGNLVGGATNGSQGNTITGNGGPGVAIVGSPATSNRVSRNSIFANGGLGIDLGLDGITANIPGDADLGPNLLQNFPIITAVSNVNGGVGVVGALNSEANATYTLDFYVNAQCDPSGNGEGQLHIGSATVKTDGGGTAPFTLLLTSSFTAAKRYVTATATDLSGNTSEFSPCAEVSLETSMLVANANDSGPGSLRDRLAAIPPGGTIRFAPDVLGTIVLISGELVLDKGVSVIGPGPDRLAISGNNLSRVFNVATGTNLIAGLTLRDGLAPVTGPTLSSQGGCVRNQSTLVISNCALLNSAARGGSGANGSAATAQFGGPGGDAEGGAIYNADDLTLIHCMVADNRAESGGGGLGGSSGPTGGPGGIAGRARGGAIRNVKDLHIVNSSIVRNRAQGAVGGFGGAGTASGGSGALGGWAEGGAIYTSGSLEIFNSTLSLNSAHGGVGGGGGSSGLSSGFGGVGGGAEAGAVYGAGQQTLFVHATIAFNDVAGGNGGLKPGGPPSGAGTGEGGGLLTGESFFLNTVVARNSAQFSPDIVGFVHSLGHNIITSSDGEQSWLPTDRIIDPLLGELAENSGPTPSHALLSGSPALDGGADANAVLADLGPVFAARIRPLITDQRGGRRVVDLTSVANAPGGNGSDIGAVEMGSIPPRIIAISFGPVQVSFTSEPGVPYRLEREEALASSLWTLVPGSERTGNGGVVLTLDSSPTAAVRFYRVITR